MGEGVTSDNKILEEIESLLDLHGLETAELIHHFYLDRLQYQKEQTKANFGQLTISAQFTESKLLVRSEIVVSTHIRSTFKLLLFYVSYKYWTVVIWFLWIRMERAIHLLKFIWCLQVDSMVLHQWKQMFITKTVFHFTMNSFHCKYCDKLMIFNDSKYFI